MPQLTISNNAAGVGGSIQSSFTRTADGGDSREVSIPAGNAGTLTTRTDNDTGTLTLENGHDIGSGNVVDLFWDGGSRYGVDVGTVAGNSVPIDLGSGDNLPTANSDIVVSKRVTIELAIGSGSPLKVLAIQMFHAGTPANSYCHLEDVADIQSFLLQGRTPRVWDVAGGAANPIVDGAIFAYVSNGATEAGTFRLVHLEDTTP